MYRHSQTRYSVTAFLTSATCCGISSAQGTRWNHGNAVYGIKPQELYSIRASRNAMRDFVGVPYNTRGALIPYQACGLDKQKRTFGRQKFFFCCLKRDKRCLSKGKNEQKVSVFAPCICSTNWNLSNGVYPSSVLIYLLLP